MNEHQKEGRRGAGDAGDGGPKNSSSEDKISEKAGGYYPEMRPEHRRKLKWAVSCTILLWLQYDLELSPKAILELLSLIDEKYRSAFEQRVLRKIEDLEGEGRSND